MSVDCILLHVQSYRASLVKAFAKTLADGYFTFVIIDDVNALVADFKEYRRMATLHGFEFYLVEMDNDMKRCVPVTSRHDAAGS